MSSMPSIVRLKACGWPGAAAGDYFGSGDYPTICPGMNHGRCLTFGRLAGILAAGGDIDKKVKSIAI